MNNSNLYSWCQRDLGIWITTDLTWNKQVLEQSAKTNKLGYVRRNTKVRRSIYLTFVRPQLVYATQIWAPQSIQLINKIEKIQRRASKFMLKLPFSTTISYSSRLQSLSLLPLCCWHEYLDHGLLLQTDQWPSQSISFCYSANPLNQNHKIIL